MSNKPYPVPEDAYFIKLSDHENQFVHFEGDNPEDSSQVIYRIKEGSIGACVFKKQNAENFIKESPGSNLILVKVRDYIKKEGK